MIERHASLMPYIILSPASRNRVPCSMLSVFLESLPLSSTCFVQQQHEKFFFHQTMASFSIQVTREMNNHMNSNGSMDTLMDQLSQGRSMQQIHRLNAHCDRWMSLQLCRSTSSWMVSFTLLTDMWQQKNSPAMSRAVEFLEAGHPATVDRSNRREK